MAAERWSSRLGFLLAAFVCAVPLLVLLVTLALLLVFAAVGWWFRERIPAPRRPRRGPRNSR